MAVRPMVRDVRPWKAWSKQTTAWRPVCLRASLMAFSTASAPELNSAVFFGKLPGVRAFRRRRPRRIRRTS